MSHSRIAEFSVPEEHREDAREAIARFVVAVREHEPGTLTYRAFERPGGRFLHLMTFEDEAAEDRHRRTEHVREFVDVLYPLCSREPVFTHVEEIAL